MLLSFGGPNGAIRVVPGTDDTCVVSASATPATAGLVVVEPTIPTAVTAVLTIRVLRPPIGDFETVRVSGSWSATGNVPGCIGSGPISVGVTVERGVNLLPPTTSNFPNSGFVIEPVSTSTGELFGHDENADLTPDGPVPFELRRYYASYLAANGVRGALGANWMHNFDLKLAVSGSEATVTLFRGKTVKFSQSGGAWRLSSTERRPYQLQVSAGNYLFLSPVSNLIYTFNATGALIRIEDRNGNALSVTQGASGPTSVSDGLGRTLTFTYTGSNLTRVQDQAGRSVSFEYSGANLSAFTDANGKRSTYAYTTAGTLTGLLTAETKPVGNRPFNQEYDSQGRVSRQTDSKSNAMTLAYTANGASVTEPLGVTLTHAHDANRNLLSESDAGGGASAQTYDANNRLTSVRDGTGGRRAVTYDAASGLPATFTDELGNITNLTYAPKVQGGFTFYDLLVARIPGNGVLSFTRDDRGNITELTDENNRKWRATWNARGQILTFTNAAGGVTTFDYDAAARLASVQADSGEIVRFSYDAAGRPNLVTHPDSATASFLYDARSNLTRFVDERSSPFSATFDDNNNLRSVTDALSAASALTRDSDELVTRQTDPLGKSTQIGYDALHRVQTVTNPTGNTLTYSYDTRNRPTSVVDVSGKGWSFTWDNESRPLSVTDALARATTVTRDAIGQVSTVTTPNNERYSRTYDTRGNIASTTDPLNRVAQYRYDAAGLLSGMTLPGGITTSIGRIELGQPTSITDPNGNIWTRAFDKMGRLASFTDPLGRTTSFQYDARQRLSRVTTPMGEAQYTYDAAGNLTRASFSDGTTLNYTYDANGRLTGGTGLSLGYDAAGRITQSNGLLNSYDDAGRLASVTYAAGKVARYTYNNRGLLSSVADWVGGSTAFTYDDAAQLTSIAYPNGVRDDRTYDRNGRIASIRLTRGGTTLSSITIRRDALGRVTGEDRSAANIPDVPGGYYPQVFDGAHQSLAATYDGLRRVTADASRRYTWDLAGRMTSYEGADGSASFTYDALGQIISRTPGVASARRPRADGDPQNIIVNFGIGARRSVITSGGDVTYNVFQPDGTPLLIIGQNNSRSFFNFDESGNLIVATDNSGSVIDTFAMTPDGANVFQTGTNSFPFTYGGAFGATQEGSTGLFFNGQWYDSTSGGSLSPSQGALNPFQETWGNGTYYAPMHDTPANVVQYGSISPINTLPYLEKLFVGTRFPPLSPSDPRTYPGLFDIRCGEDAYDTAKAYRNPITGAFLPSDFTVRQQPRAGTGNPIQTPVPWQYIQSMYRGVLARRGADPGTTSLPIPRFADTSTASNIFTIVPAVTNLLFPFVTNQLGFDTGLAINNTSQDPFGTSGQTGACRLNGVPPGVGTTYTTVLSSGGALGIAATPGFQGYLIAQCNFQYAHGFAFISDVGAQRVAEGYLALILDQGQGISGNGRTSSVRETLGH